MNGVTVEYQISIHETKRVDIDNISYQIDLISKEGDLSASVGATMIISQNAWHLHEDAPVEELGIDPAALQDALENRAYSIVATLPIPEMSRDDVIEKIQDINPWFNQEMDNFDAASDQIYRLLKMGVGFGNISLYRSGDSGNCIVVKSRNVDEVAEREMRGFFKFIDNLIDDLKQDNEVQARELESEREKVIENLSLLGSDYISFF